MPPTSQVERLRRITSGQNALVKELRRSFREAAPSETGHVAIEGVRQIEEAIRSGLQIHAVFFSESGQARAGKLLPQLKARTEALVLPDDVFASAIETETPQGVAALVTVRKSSLAEMLAPADPLVVVACGIQDPGNLGTMARSAEAFGASGLALCEGTVSRFNAKVIRASAGSLFRLSATESKVADLLPKLRARGIRLIGTSSHKGTPLPDLDLTGGCALFIGNEGAGLPKDVHSAMDELLTIPHASKVESLNAGVATSVVLYEAARQRRLHPA